MLFVVLLLLVMSDSWSTAIAASFEDPMFPRPGGSTVVSKEKSATIALRYEYLGEKLLITYVATGPGGQETSTRVDYLGYSPDGSYLEVPPESLLRFERASHELRSFSAGVSMPSDFRDGGASRHDDTAWCELELRCGNVTVKRDERRRFVLTYTNNETDANQLARYTVLMAVTAVMRRAMADVPPELRAGAAPQADQPPQTGDWVWIGPNSEEGRLFHVNGTSATWIALDGPHLKELLAKYRQAHVELLPS